MRVRAAVVTAAVIGFSWVLPAQAFGVVVGDWQMNEASGNVMTDTSGNGFDGHIGSAVVLHEATGDGGFAYRFKGDFRIVNDERLVDWPDEGAALDAFD